MKKATSKSEQPDMLEEYDFSKGVRGKYAESYQSGCNIAVLSPDVAEYFPDSQSVNTALRALVRIAQTKTRKGVGT